MSIQFIDAKYAGLGFNRRPWSPADHLAEVVISNLVVTGIRNGKAIYSPIASSADYLRGKGVKVDTTLYPLGYWYKSLTFRNVFCDDIGRSDGVSHNDGIYICETPYDGTKFNLTVENYTLTNTDYTVMPILIQPGNYETITLRNLNWDSTVLQRRVVLKGSIQIDRILVENCSRAFTINPPDGTGTGGGLVKTIELVNSPLVNVSQFTGLPTTIIRR